jgi:putative tryptophan/tyrosine transport system substrate-binding protein
VDRRYVLHTFAVGLLATPVAARAQSAEKVYRIGYLTAVTASSPSLAAFRQGLRDLGWVEGHNIVIEYRSGEGRYDRLADVAAELVRLNVDVIVAAPTPAALAAKKATTTVPIVGVSLTEPVGIGLVTSLARPGGNVTGVSYSVGTDIFGKDLALLKEVVPKVRRVAVLSNPDSPAQPLTISNIKDAARPLGLKLLLLEARAAGDFDGAFSAMARARVGALFIVTDPVFIPHRARLINLAARNLLPSISTQRADAEAGGLISYGPNFADMYRRAASYVDKILKGAKPGDLPVEQPTSFEFVINLKTAKALGLSIPQSVLARADQVIE